MSLLHFRTGCFTPHYRNGWTLERNVATIGRFHALTLTDLRRYVRAYPVHWITL